MNNALAIHKEFELEQKKHCTPTLVSVFTPEGDKVTLTKEQIQIDRESWRFREFHEHYDYAEKLYMEKNLLWLQREKIKLLENYNYGSEYREEFFRKINFVTFLISELEEDMRKESQNVISSSNEVLPSDEEITQIMQEFQDRVWCDTKDESSEFTELEEDELMQPS